MDATIIEQLHIRIPAELKAALEEWAGDERRSLNAQVVTILEQAVKDRQPPDAAV